MKSSAAIMLLVLAIAAPARADVEGDLGLGARASALAGAVGAVGGDYTATAYNPGALVLPSDRGGLAEIGASVIIAAPDVWVRDLDGMRLDTCGMDPGPTGIRACGVVPASSTYALTAGARFDIGNAIGLPGLVLGFAVYSPFAGLVESAIRPDDTLQWLTLTDSTQHISLFASLAYRFTEWLSIGAGARILFDEETYITGVASDVHMAAGGTIEADARLGVSTAIYGRAAPALGVLVSPLPTLRFGFAWRGELYSNDWGHSRLAGIDSVGEIGFLHHFFHIYHPHELAWSAAWEPIPILRFSAELTWAMWSLARSPNVAELRGRFGDVLIPAAGVRVGVHPGVDVLAGYRYMHRPYDDFGGPTNLLSADSHTVSLGLELDLDRLIDDPVPFTITLAGRLAIFEDREEAKNGRRFPDDHSLLVNPGYPGYRYGGLVPSVQLGVETRW